MARPPKPQRKPKTGHEWKWNGSDWVQKPSGTIEGGTGGTIRDPFNQNQPSPTSPTTPHSTASAMVQQMQQTAKTPKTAPYPTMPTGIKNFPYVQTYTPPTEQEEGDRPGRPDRDLPGGWTWGWDEELNQWIPTPGEEEEDAGKTKRDNDLFARLKGILRFWGLDEHAEADQFLKDALRFGWSSDEFRENLRQSNLYLGNPLFAANVERARNGKGFMDEAQVIAWGTEAKRLAKQYGYNEPSDNYLAAGLTSGLSMAEIEHRFQIQDRVNLYGAGVKMAAQEMGFEIGDSDLFEIFDPERDTKQWDDMFRRAQMRGRPLTLGLGIRSETEARALEMLGLSADEAFKRYEGVAANASRFARLGTIEESIRKGLPAEFGQDLSTVENSVLLRGLLFNDPAALAELQNVTMREVARWKGGGGAATTQSGQAVGLLTVGERQNLG